MGLKEGMKQKWIRILISSNVVYLFSFHEMKRGFFSLCIKNSWRWLQLWKERRETILLLQLRSCLLWGWDRLPDRWPQGEGSAVKQLSVLWWREHSQGVRTNTGCQLPPGSVIGLVWPSASFLTPPTVQQSVKCNKTIITYPAGVWGLMNDCQSYWICLSKR